MKVNELINFMGETKNKLLKADQLQDVLKKKLEVKNVYVVYVNMKKLVKLLNLNIHILNQNG